jgi:hypothetical protein
VQFSRDGKWIASGSFDRTIRVWRADNGQLVRVLRGHEQAVVGIAISPDSQLLASGGDDSTVRIWRLSDGALLPTRATSDGDGSPPPILWEVTDPQPVSYALICEDPDAPRATPFVHWLVYGIRGEARSLDSNLGDFREGLNDHGEIGFAPASPCIHKIFIIRVHHRLWLLPTELFISVLERYSDVAHHSEFPSIAVRLPSPVRRDDRRRVRRIDR